MINRRKFGSVGRGLFVFIDIGLVMVLGVYLENKINNIVI